MVKKVMLSVSFFSEVVPTLGHVTVPVVRVTVSRLQQVICSDAVVDILVTALVTGLQRVFLGAIRYARRSS